MPELAIPAAGGPRARRERVARLGIRTAEVAIVPPRRDRPAGPLPAFAVPAAGTAPPDGGEPLHWLLPTAERPAEGEADAVHAATVPGRHRTGLGIGTWFRTLRTGTRLKGRRPDSADDLRRCLAFDAVTARPASPA